MRVCDYNNVITAFYLRTESDGGNVCLIFSDTDSRDQSDQEVDDEVPGDAWLLYAYAGGTVDY